MLEEQHAEFKDAYQDLEARIDEVAEDMRKLPTDYAMVEQYNSIDKEINEVSEWYEEKRKELFLFIETYKLECKLMNVKISKIDWLQLDHKGHKRILFKFNNDFSANWIAS